MFSTLLPVLDNSYHSLLPVFEDMSCSQNIWRHISYVLLPELKDNKSITAYYHYLKIY